VESIQVGKAIAKENLGIMGDDEGDNISMKNPYYNELTATYWIWKNVKADAVGLFHYRRFFNFKTLDTKCRKIMPSFFENYGITKENIAKLLSKYDIVLPNKTGIVKESLYECYQREHIISDMDYALEAIEEKYPGMAKIAEKVVRHNSQTYCANMLIASKKLFDEYAHWLFDVLFEVEGHIQRNVLGRDSYQRRAYGFLAERMMTVFIEYKKQTSGLKIKEVPILFLEDKMSKWCAYLIRRFRRKFLTAIGLEKEHWKMGW
jgi:hypothetical protein